jgi:acyl-CoA synthetase (AMP-forming)/AMP-acid ligase II/acyl carrier protein
VILTWLPFHHDMGLIGNILHSIYVGCTCVVMSPLHFVQQPIKWLQAIGRYQVTHSGGPNFAYDHCVHKIPQEAVAGLDLRSWKVAFNGAEPVRAESLQQFAARFGTAGFDAAAFHPCYGMAEATLLVSGCKPIGQSPQILYIENSIPIGGALQLETAPGPASKAVVSSGMVPAGMAVRVLGPNGSGCGELEPGEICIHGNSVTQGYWNRDNTDVFYQLADGPYLRTGDAGFMYKGELFVSGRLKEMLIIRGENFYPYDIEHQVAAAVEAIEPNGVAAFGVEAPQEALVLVAELKRTHLQTADRAAIIAAMEAELTGIFGIEAYDIMLTTPLGIPRTTSGKIQRLQCRALYLQNGFTEIGSKRGLALRSGPAMVDWETLLQPIQEKTGLDNIKAYLTALIHTKTGQRVSDENQDLFGLGIDSLRAAEIMYNINTDLDINMQHTVIFEYNTLAALAGEIGQLLWLKKGAITTEGEIEI